MKALVEIGVLFLLPYLFRLCRRGTYIRVRIRPRRAPGITTLLAIALLVLAVSAIGRPR